MAAVYIRSDKMYDAYNRRVLDLLTFMGSLGGLFETLKYIGLLIFGTFAHWLFMSKVIKHVYQVRNYDNVNHAVDRKFKSQESERRRRESEYQTYIKFDKDEEYLYSKEFKDKTKIESKDFVGLLHPFLNRVRFKYTVQDII